MQLIKYRRRDGQIEAIWTSNSRDLLAGHVAETDEEAGYLFREEETVGVSELVERWSVQEGQLREKVQVTLIAEPETFVADGDEICLIGVLPATSCTILINGEPYALTADEPCVTLTSPTPQTFAVQIQSHPAVWALPITVTAVEEA